MKRHLFRAAACMCVALAGWSAARASELTTAAATGKPVASKSGKSAAPPTKSEGGCGDHGTSVEFFDTPSSAAAKAKKEQKLVFVLHVSGNFEDPRFT